MRKLRSQNQEENPNCEYRKVQQVEDKHIPKPAPVDYTVDATTDKDKITWGVDGYGRQHFVCRICWEELGIGGNWWDYTCDCWNK